MANKTRLTVLVVVLVFLYCLPSAQSKTKNRREDVASPLLADNRGGISHLFLHFADYDIIPTLYDLLRATPERTHITIASPKGARTKVLESLLDAWTFKEKPNFSLLPVDQAMNFWIRDDFVVADNKRIILPKRYRHKQRPQSITWLEEKSGFTVINSKIDFDGGNVVVSEDTVFVGYNIILDNIGTDFPNPEKLYRYLERLFGKKLVVVGSAGAPLPHGHIDMFLTPAKSGVLLVGDPQLAIDILKKDRTALSTVYGKVYFDESRTPIPQGSKAVLFQTADFVERLQEDLLMHSRDRVEGDDDLTLATLFAKNALPSSIALFDGIAKDLKEKGYKKIVRLPILTNTNLDGGPFITYNNMLIDDTNGVTRAYLPRYNIASLDRAAQKIMRRAGFEVIPVDVQNISFYNGTLRCITQVLSRSSK